MSNTQTAVAAADKVIVVDELVDSGVYGNYQLDQIRISRTNRKRFNEAALQELAANVKAVGIVQPILIRPVTPTEAEPQIYEVVAGERRYRASTIAGIETIPAVLRSLTDAQAREIQILENLQREDPHPMEEAEGFQELMLQAGFTADQLAEKLHKSRAYIYARLKLCSLALDVREKFLNNEISASTALLIARIPLPALQTKALSEILTPSGWPAEPMSYRKAAEHLQNRYTLDLGTAKFSLTDSKLLVAAGACSKCPKKTGNQPEIFADIKNPDVCTDPGCFADKRAAHDERTIAQATKAGIPFIEGDEAAKMLQSTWDTTAEFASPNTPLWKFERNAPTTKNAGVMSTYLKAEELPTPAALIKDKAGNVVPLYNKASVQLALEKVAACESAEQQAARLAAQENDPGQKEKLDKKRATAQAEEDEHAKQVAKAELETTFRSNLYQLLRVRGMQGFNLASLRAFMKLMMEEFSLPSTLQESVYSFNIKDDNEVGAYIDQASLAEVQLLLVDAMIGHCLEVRSWTVDDDNSTFDTLLAMARSEGINTVQVRKEVEMKAIELEDLTERNISDFIEVNPDRINELAKFILEHRPHFIFELEVCANLHGFEYGTDGKTGSFSRPQVATPIQPDTTHLEDAPAALKADEGDYMAPSDFEVPAAPAAARPAGKTPKSRKSPAKTKADDWPWPTSETAAAAAETDPTNI